MLLTTEPSFQSAKDCILKMVNFCYLENSMLAPETYFCSMAPSVFTVPCCRGDAAIPQNLRRFPGNTVWQRNPSVLSLLSSSCLSPLLSGFQCGLSVRGNVCMRLAGLIPAGSAGHTGQDLQGLTQTLSPTQSSCRQQRPSAAADR